MARAQQSDTGCLTLNGQHLLQHLLTRRGKNAFLKPCPPGLPHRPPHRMDGGRRPMLQRHLRQSLRNQLPRHLLQHLQLRPAPPAGEERRCQPHPVHDCPIDVVEPIVRRSQVDRHHRLSVYLFCALLIVILSTASAQLAVSRCLSMQRSCRNCARRLDVYCCHRCS